MVTHTRARAHILPDTLGAWCLVFLDFKLSLLEGWDNDRN